MQAFGLAHLQSARQKKAQGSSKPSMAPHRKNVATSLALLVMCVMQIVLQGEQPWPAMPAIRTGCWMK